MLLHISELGVGGTERSLLAQVEIFVIPKTLEQSVHELYIFSRKGSNQIMLKQNILHFSNIIMVMKLL